MEEQVFKLYTTSSGIVIKKGNTALFIKQESDNDTLFSTESDEAFIEFDFYTNDCVEWQTEQIFESLMKSIIGRYILKEHQTLKYFLPDDFIDLEKRRIVWHSDSGVDNTLLIQYKENKIFLSLTKEETAKNNQRNVVRIRTNGSSYEYYYQEFTQFYKKLEELAQRFSKDMLNVAEEKNKEKCYKKM